MGILVADMTEKTISPATSTRIEIGRFNEVDNINLVGIGITGDGKGQKNRQNYWLHMPFADGH